MAERYYQRLHLIHSDCEVCNFVELNLLLKLSVELKDCHCSETLKLFKLTSQCLERAQDLLSTSQGSAMNINLWC